MNLLQRCEFVRASADDLGMFENESVDAITTRSVLIYVYAKQQAFKEFHRVLRPGGQLSERRDGECMRNQRNFKPGFLAL